ncbi:MAG TPA: alpha/beta fold hydrolase [Gemmatimonadales bacterium]|nr:alpha/beta fold hydrolase [Gemmatimonadales bacterium]
MAQSASSPSRPRPGGARVTALRTAFRTVGAVAPGVAARWAESIFCRPPRQEARPHEEAFLATGRPRTFGTSRAPLHGWEWGEGPLVVLVHGWGSRAGRWAGLAPLLLARGFRVVTYDAPAHGRTPGRLASLPEFADALQEVIAATGPAHGVVGHSLGGAAIAVALGRGLPAERAVLIAAPAHPEGFADRFAEVLAIPPLVRATMQRNLEERLRFRWSDLHIPTISRGLGTPALIVHDDADADVPVAEAQAIAGAWPGAELHLTSGLGHRAIIRDPAVLARAAAFLSIGVPVRG